jgi:hypothetical protein
MTKKMANAEKNDELPKGEILVYQAEDSRIKLDVRLEDETVWLTQQLVAELFQTTVPNISMHIRNIYEEGELSPEATVKKFLTVRREGDRDVRWDDKNLKAELPLKRIWTVGSQQEDEYIFLK